MVEKKFNIQGIMGFVSQGTHKETDSNGGTIGQVIINRYEDVTVVTVQESHEPCEFEIHLTIPNEMFDNFVNEW